MNRPNKDPQADRQDVRCQLFQQQLDGCLDGRGWLSTLDSNPHLVDCSDCRTSLEIYRQFDSAGGAVLNGGAGKLPSNRKQGTSISRQHWLPLTSVAVAAALMISLVAWLPMGQPNNQFAAIDSASNLVSETTAVNDHRSAVVNAQQQPTAEPFHEVATISQRLLRSGWEKPWQYTSELPGIRPFHRSVHVALVLYNDSLTLL